MQYAIPLGQGPLNPRIRRFTHLNYISYVFPNAGNREEKFNFDYGEFGQTLTVNRSGLSIPHFCRNVISSVISLFFSDRTSGALCPGLSITIILDRAVLTLCRSLSSEST